MQYSVFEEHLTTPDGIGYTAYGLRCAWQIGAQLQVQEISDVSPDENFARSLAAQCNAGQLDPRLFEGLMTDAALEPSEF